MSSIIRRAQVGLAVSAFALFTSHSVSAAALNIRFPDVKTSNERGALP